MTQLKAGQHSNTMALIAVCLAALMFGLEISSVPVILPTLEKLMNADFKSLQWIMNAYTIACTTVLMATGTLADKYGRKLVFSISVILFGITSLICGIAQDTAVLIVGRFLQGIGGGAMLICSIAILSFQFQDGKDRARAFSTWGVITGIGLGFGPIIGSAIIAFSGWRWVFLIHLPLSVLTIFLTLRSVRESKDGNAKRLDIAGICSLSLSVFCLTWFITQGSIVILLICLISLISFLIIEKKQTYPMFDFSVFKVRNFSGAIMGSIGMNFSFWPLIIYLPIYFQTGLHYSVAATGLTLLAYTLPTLFMPPVAERLSLRYQPRILIPGGMLIIGLGLLAMAFSSRAIDASWVTMLPGMLLAGIGLGLINTPVTNTTTGSVSKDRAGMASGIDMSARLITLAINISIMGLLYSAKGFAWVSMYGSIGVCVLACLSWLLFFPYFEKRK